MGVRAEVATLVRAASQDVPIEQAVGGASVTTARAFREAADSLRAQARFEGQPTEAPSLAAIEPVAEARTSLGQVAIDLGDTAQARWVGQNALGDLLDRLRRGSKWPRPCGHWALPRSRSVASPLPARWTWPRTAWTPGPRGIAADRQRTLAQGEGITLGAFGYVENIRLGARGQEPQGWLHAPSGAHAIAAGMLASAHRSNIGAQTGRQPFAIDLGSRRGGALRRVLEGMRAGQSIGALVGYQIERGLTGSAARFQLSLRELAPAITDTLGTDLPPRRAHRARGGSQRGRRCGFAGSFPWAATLDASTLRAAACDDTEECICDGLGSGRGRRMGHRARLPMEAAETLDAVSDALLAESVLQYASGNASRASHGDGGGGTAAPRSTRTSVCSAFARPPAV